jgi:hypothetical protein
MRNALASESKMSSASWSPSFRGSRIFIAAAAIRAAATNANKRRDANPRRFFRKILRFIFALLVNAVHLLIDLLKSQRHHTGIKLLAKKALEYKRLYSPAAGVMTCHKRIRIFNCLSSAKPQAIPPSSTDFQRKPPFFGACLYSEYD